MLNSCFSSILQNQQQDQIPLVSPPLVDLQKQQKLDLQTIQPHFQTPTSPTTNQQTVLDANTDASQEQTKFVFNVDTEKTSQSLQLLFQLPNVQQQQAGGQPQTAGVLTSSPASQNQNVCQTSVIQSKQNNLQTTNDNNAAANTTFVYGGGGIIHHPCPIISQNQVPSLCNQHSQQVQVATQTPQQTDTAKGWQQEDTTKRWPQPVPKTFQSLTSNNNNNNINNTNNQGLDATKGWQQPPDDTAKAWQLENPSSSNQQLQQQTQQQPTTVAPSKFSTTANKKSIEKSRRDRKTVLRQTSTPNTNTAMQQLAIRTQPGPDKKIDVDSETDSNHDTALTLACAGGHEELVELLIQRNASIEHRDKKGFTPLILAATAGHEKVVNILLKHGAELEAQSERTKDTPLSLACSGGRYEVVEILLNVGANKEHRNVSDYTPLSLAASGGYVNIIRLLLNHGAEINSRTGSKLGISPLMLAAMNGHTSAVKLLLDMGSDINAQIETNRNTALTLACFQGRHEVVSLLLDRKANVEHRAKTGLTPLMEAASGGYIEVGRVLLDKGADVNATPVPSSRDTALTIAADKGHLKFVDLLLQRGAAVEVKNKKGNSPLWLAANGGHLSVVKILKNHSADIDSQDNRRVSCLMAAFRKGHTKVVEFMVNHVTQFPSDQEMTRYIATVSDKDLSDKCKECVKTIRAAKEAQAVKANKNASILLEELDMEKNREESRKAAAARRRERKKKKKMEKKEEKRKLMESEQPTGKENSKNKSSANNDNKEVTSPEKEETDSGIDVHSQGSYSSTDNKNNNVSNKSNDNSKIIAKDKHETNATTSDSSNSKKNQKASKNSSSNQSKKNKSPNRAQESEDEKETKHSKHMEKNNATETKSATTYDNVSEHNNSNNNNSNNNNSSNSNINTNNHKTNNNQQKDGKHQRNANHDANDRENAGSKEATTITMLSSFTTTGAAATSATFNNNVAANSRGKDKERIAANKEIHADASDKAENHSKSNAHEPIVTAVHHKTISNTRNSNNSSSTIHHNNDIGDGDITYFNSTRNKTNKPVAAASLYDNSNKTTQNAPKQNASHTFKREEGWKEVSRKSSTQQHTATDMSVKKIIIPTYAISRVIGRAGSNINAIRAATGAHIEVEKQGKSQNDRMITIKGSTDATKQASVLIGALVKDPEVDILQMLPKVNTNARSVPPPNVVEKPIVIVQPTTSVVTSTTNVTIAKTTKPIATVATSIMSTTSKTVNSTALTQRSGVHPANKSLTQTVPLQSRTITIGNRSLIASDTSSFKKANEPFPSVKIVSSTASSTSSASTVDHSSLIALKNTIKISTAEAFGTFAAKVASDVKPIVSATENNPIHSSPKHTISAVQQPQQQQQQQQPPAPFSNVFNSEKSIKPASIQNYSSAMLSNTDTITASTVTSSIANRIITSSPIIQAAALQQTDPKALQSRQKSGVQLPIVPNPQSHEYSLFDSSFASNTQWEQKSTFNGRNAENYLESDSLPKADASKAPGYRGANLNSPVNSKNLKLTKADVKPLMNDQIPKELEPKVEQVTAQKVNEFKQTEPSEQLDSIPNPKRELKLDHEDLQRADKCIDKEPPLQDIEKQQIVSHISPIGTAPAKLPAPIGAQLNIAASQTAIKPNTSVYANTVSDSYSTGIIRPPSMQPLAPSQDISTSRSLSQSQLRMMPTPIDSINIDTKANQNYYDPSYRNMNYGSNVDAMQTYQQGMNSNQMSMSRLNPRASVFSSIQNNNPIGKSNNQMPMMNQPYGRNNMFSQNPNQSMNTNYNPYQKMPFNNQNSNNTPSFYNRAPGRPQSQPQASSNGRMFGEFAHSSHTSPNDTFNLDHSNLVMPSSMSPNGNNNSQTATNKNMMQTDDNRRMIRPIGTERASWKHNTVNIGGLNSNLENVDNMNQHSLPPWLLEKNHLQAQQLSQQQQPQTQQMPQNQAQQQQQQHHANGKNKILFLTANIYLNFS